MLSDQQIQANNVAMRFTQKLEHFIQSNYYHDFSVTAKFDWSFKRRSSRGGIYKNGPGINMAMSSAALVYLASDDVYRFYEYPSYDDDPVIGGFYHNNYELKLKAIVAHEVAHAAQFFEYKKLNVRCKPHGAIFKKYYGLFRTQFINAELGDQKVFKKSYDALLAKYS